MASPDIIQSVSAGGSARAKRDYWNEMVAQAINPLEFRTQDWESFSASMQTRTLGAAALTLVTSDPWQVSVTNDLLMRRRSDRVIVQVCLSGQLNFNHEGTAAIVTAGQMSIADSQRAHRLRCDNGARVLCLTIDRAHLGGALKAIENRAVVFSGSEPIAKVTMDLIKTSWKSLPKLDDSQRALLEPRLGRMVAETLAWHDPSQDPASSHILSMIYRAKLIVRQRLGEMEFGSVELAQAMGVTRRYLTTLFQSINDTPADYIRRVRLHVAWDKLTDKESLLSIGEIGASVGFASGSQFSRAVKSAFSLTPNELRRLKFY